MKSTAIDQFLDRSHDLMPHGSAAGIHLPLVCWRVALDSRTACWSLTPKKLA